MNINNLLTKIAQYEALTKRLNKKINEYIAYIYGDNIGINYNDTPVCLITLDKLKRDGIYEIIGFYSTSPTAAVIGLSLINRFYSPVIPDQRSLTSDSFRILTNYFDKNKDNPNLIKKWHLDKPLTPFNALFLHNPALDNLSKDIQIVKSSHLTNHKEFASYEEFFKKYDDVFKTTYKKETIIPIDEDELKDLIEKDEQDETESITT